MTDTTERILDLMIAEATVGLGDAERDALDALLLDVDADEARNLRETVQASLAAAGNAGVLASDRAGPDKADEPPDTLVAALEADADRFFGTPGGVVDLERARRRRAVTDSEAPHRRAAARRGGFLAASGWAVAALLLLAVWVTQSGEAPSAAEARGALLTLQGTERFDWAIPDAEGFEGVRGDVSWNDERQEGYLRLRGMPANDPRIAQYQLWIVDPGRDAEPVDGGVFDIPAVDGEVDVVVPIRATLPVARPVAFAITREQPGGVVVSEGPLLVVASRG